MAFTEWIKAKFAPAGQGGVNVKTKRVSPPTVFKVSKNALSQDLKSFYATDLADFRYESDLNQSLLNLSKYDPDVSQALQSIIAVSHTKYRYMCYTPDGAIDRRAFFTLRKILLDLDYYYWQKGYDWTTPLDAFINTQFKFAWLRGACASELVLGSDRSLLNPAPIDPYYVKWRQTVPNVYTPYMEDKSGGSTVEVSMDIPNFFFSTVTPDPGEPMPTSPILSVLENIFFSLQVLRDLQKVCNRVGFTRYYVSVVHEALIKSMPQSVRNDVMKQNAYIDDIFTQIRNELEDVNPEDAVILSDYAKLDTLEAKAQSNLEVSFEPIIRILDQKVSSGLKTLPTILGRTLAKGSDGKTESIIYSKFAGMYQRCVADHLSRMFTLALRLNGSKAHCRFEFEPINLRPDSELENQYVMKQKRCIELVKLGVITMDELSYELTGTIPQTDVNYAKIYGKYIETDTKFTLTTEEGDDPSNANGEEDPQSRRNDNEDIVAEGGTPKPSNETEGA